MKITVFHEVVYNDLYNKVRGEKKIKMHLLVKASNATSGKWYLHARFPRVTYHGHIAMRQ